MLEYILSGIVVILGISAVLYAANKIRVTLNNLPHIDNADPIRLCRKYVEQGCPELDSGQCSIKTCSLLKDYNCNKNGND